MERETRDAQYLRLLEAPFGPLDPSDYAAARYLKDKGYGECDMVTSPDGDTLHVMWKRATAAGEDFADALRARAEAQKAGRPHHDQADHDSSHQRAQKPQWWKDHLTGVLAVGVLASLIAGVLLMALL